MTVSDDPAPALTVVPEVELLERALGWTCGHLCRVGPADLPRATPCSTWNLAALLAHMEDSLDAFAEAAAGFVTPLPAPRLPESAVPQVPVLQAKATALLGSWTRPVVPVVRTGSARIPSRLLIATGALEISVHGWDVAASLGRAPSLPSGLAADLWPIATRVVTPADRPARFAAARERRPCDPGDRLLAFLGR